MSLVPFSYASPVLVGLNLPYAVDLDAKIHQAFPTLEGHPDRAKFEHVEQQAMRAGVLEMPRVACNASIATPEFPYCGACISSDEQDPSARVPLANLLTFAEGDLATAHGVAGVDAAQIVMLAPPICDLASTPEFVLEKRDYFRYLTLYQRHLEFDMSWKQLNASVGPLRSVASAKAGEFSFSAHHMQSLQRTMAKVRQLAETKYVSDCTPSVKFIAAGCKAVRATVGYRTRGSSSFKQVAVDEVLLPNAQAPADYFSALVKCPSDPYKVIFM